MRPLLQLGLKLFGKAEDPYSSHTGGLTLQERQTLSFGNIQSSCREARARL
jgi:hypothetical protein